MRIAAGLLACVLLLAAAEAWARDAAGLLANIVTPNEGRPAVVTAGGTFEVVLEAAAELQLVGPEGPIPLTQKASTTEGTVVVRATVPQDTPAGRYDIEAVSADVRDYTARSVWVVAETPAVYTVALLAEPQMGEGTGDVVRALVRAVNASDTALVLVLGNLTATGAADEFQQLVGALAALDAPAFVCPGPNDRQQGLYEAYFGPVPYAFAFGPDSYLAIDTSRSPLGVARNSGDLFRLRRSIRAARWSAGFTHRYTPGMALRDQLTLFVDDPLDVLAFGREDAAEPADPVPLAVGRVPYLTVPPAADGYVRFVRVTATEPEAGAAVRLEALQAIGDVR